MSVYVDDMLMQATVPNGNRSVTGRWSHLFADTEEELIEFAVSKLGMKPSWLQYSRGDMVPHFDLVESKRKLALKHGAIDTPVRSPEWMALVERGRDTYSPQPPDPKLSMTIEKGLGLPW